MVIISVSAETDVLNREENKTESTKPSAKRQREDSEEVMEMRDEIKVLRGDIERLDGKQ